MPTIWVRKDPIAPDEQRKLFHSIVVDCLDRTAKVAFAIADPRLGAGAIETCRRRIDRSSGFCCIGHEIGAETATARASHVPKHGCHEVFPNGAGITDVDVHDAARDGIVRDARTGFSDDEAAVQTLETPTSPANHGSRKIYSQIIDLGFGVTHGEECGKRAVTATNVIQCEWGREIANLQELDEAEALGGLARPVHP